MGVNDPRSSEREFRPFLKGLPARHGYCVACLSHLYDKPPTESRWLLVGSGLTSRTGECGNCHGPKHVLAASPHPRTPPQTPWHPQPSKASLDQSP
jgi:hypothetical protein